MRGASRRRRGGRRRGRDWVVLDMEDDGIRERTCALHRELLDDGLPAGLTLQARRLRTLPDLEWAVRQRTSLRLVKGPSRCARWTIAARAHRRGLSGGGRDHAVATGARGGFPAGVRHP